MISILTQVEVEDFEHFRRVFSTKGLEMRTTHGSKSARLFHDSTDPNRVTILFEWESREAFQGFLDDPNVKETMKSSGIKASPRFTFLQSAEELPG